MEDQIRSNVNKEYYRQRKAKDTTSTKVTNNKAAIHEQLLLEKCKALDLPEFLAPYIKINKHSVAFIAPSRDDLLELCMLIADNAELVQSYYTLTQSRLRNAANYTSSL
jgi:hypothetical protein